MLKFGNDAMDFFERCKYTTPFIMHSPHTHDYHELYFLENGQTTYFIGSSIYILNAGDFIFIPQGQLHQTDNSRYPHIERVLLNFDDRFISDKYMYLLEELKASPYIQLPEAEIPKFRKIIKRIEQEAMSNDSNCELLQQLYLHELLVLISRHRKSDTTVNYGSAHRIAQATAQYISTNYDKPICLSTLAKEYSVSEGYLSKLFKKYTGMGINQYINISRIMAAKEMLNNTDMSVTEVAYECGFNDSNYFSLMFKKLTGISPKKYSMQYKNANKLYHTTLKSHTKIDILPQEQSKNYL